MPRHEFPLIVLTALLGLAAPAHADPSDYGKVDTFEPGKKYNCVPTADRKGWDCSVTGQSDVPPAAAPAPAPAAPAHEAVPAAAPEQPASHAGTLPGYLTNSGANQSMQPMPAAPAPKPAPPPRVKGPQVPARAPATAAANPPPAPQKPAAAVPQPAPAVVTPPPQKPAATTPAEDDFLALPADAYVIELAHAADEAGLAAQNPAGKKVYKLRLRQNGTEVWLLVCGPYASLQAARTARDELAAQGATPGWPRRIGPLQTEARRLQP